MVLAASLLQGGFIGVVSGEPASAAAPTTRPTLDLHVHTNGRVRLTGQTRLASETLYVERYTVYNKKYTRMETIRSTNHRFSVLLPARTVWTIYTVREQRTGVHSHLRSIQPRFDECGLRPLRGDGTLYYCSWNENFTGTSLDPSKWYVHSSETPVSGNTAGAAACYSPDNVSVSQGSLKLVARYATLLECPGLTGALKILTSGQVSTYRKFSQRYGRFEVRSRSTATRRSGLHEAFWLWPDDRHVDVTQWPVSGEIDVTETYSSYPDLSIPFVHSRYDAYGQILTGPYANTAWHCEARRGVWNTYRLDWTSERIEIHVNGRLCLTHTSGDPAFDEPFIIALTQLIGKTNNNFNILQPPPIPATYEVDYVRVWN